MVWRDHSNTAPLPTTSSDIWSTGVTMYILLMGYPPFDHLSPDLHLHILKANYPIIKEDWKDISFFAQDLVRILQNIKQLLLHNSG